MNPDTFQREDIIRSLSPALAAAVCLFLFLVWIGLLFLRRRLAFPAWAGHTLGFLIATASTWFGLQFLGSTLSLATSWPLLALSIIGAASAEFILLIYHFEQSLVKQGRSHWLLTLRLGTLATLILVLAQPVRSFLETREIEREIAILIDQSDSMLLTDQRLNATEKLDRAALFGVSSLEKRPPLREVEKISSRLSAKFAEEQSALLSAPSPLAALESRSSQLAEFFKSSRAFNKELIALLDELSSLGLPADIQQRLEDYRKRSRDGITRILDRAETAFNNKNGEELLKQISVAQGELSGILNTLPGTYANADTWFYLSLEEMDREEIDANAATSRIEIARRILESPLSTKSRHATAVDEVSPGDAVDGTTLLERLGGSYNLRLYHFDNNIRQFSSLEEGDWTADMGTSPGRALTDFSGAMEKVLETTSPESLAGVLLLSDGRHNGPTLPEDSLRQLAVQNTPLSAVPIGGALGPVDMSILSLEAPESIYLDDRILVSAEVKLDGLLGKEVEATLFANDVIVEKTSIEVTDINFRTELSFVHRPEEKGILDYEIRLKPDPDEIFQNNNHWDFKVAVTDDRTNVLLVDGFPRWEFRYLRNLFYGRDKSVHLQFVLLDPDEIYRGPQIPRVPASATRPFGEAEATTLPSTPDEWSLFDVIILGDIAPSALSPRDWKAIEEAVTQRGSLLVCVAGFRHMPHGHTSTTLQNLLPINYTPGGAVQFNSPEPAFRVSLTPEGRNHPVTSQSTSRAINQDRWSGFPAMTWRFAHDSVKETAEVLAFARSAGSGRATSSPGTDGSPESIEAALEQLANRKQLEQENAVITSIRAGLGKVLMLNFDQTWRFRYGVGDTYHHRFWGQITRWGAGENLRSGNDYVRIGTDRLSYTTQDPVEVTAKILDQDRKPVVDANLKLEVWMDGSRLSTQKMSYRSESSGIYETSLGGLGEAGEYELKLTGKEVENGLAMEADGPSELATELLVVKTRNPVELAELTADRDFLNRATRQTGGRLSELHELESLLTSFGSPKETLQERRNVTLWDTWPLLLTFLGLLTSEWILRRRSGLV
ncbi:MAG: hypothetical protein AAF733_07525 [Verrucomicrobiota bacterium]